MASGFSIGYINFTVFLLLLTGTLIIMVDVKGYDTRGMAKEKKAAGFLGWMNIFLGILSFLGNWVYQKIM